MKPFLRLLQSEPAYALGLRRRVSPRLWFGAALLLATPQVASAAVFNIPNGDIAALRAAIVTANSNAQDDTINLAPNGTYIFNEEWASATALPAISRDGDHPNPFHDVTINGNNATLARSTAAGTPEFRLLAATNGTGGNSSLLIISNITFTNGRVPANVDGGGILMAGLLILNNCTISNSYAGGNGGGILAANGQLEMNGCTVAGNFANTNGGGIWNGQAANVSAVVRMTNCTFSGNSARALGGTIYNQDQQDGGNGDTNMTVHNCTLKGGSVYNSGGFQAFARIYFGNTIFSGCPIGNNDPQNIGVTRIYSEGYNLSDGNDNGWLTHSEDFTNANAGLDPEGLKFNGGPTQTIALVAGSAAIDQGYWFSVGADQRGSPRPVDNPSIPNNSDGSDIGAFETAADPTQGGVGGFIVTTTADHNDGVCGGIDCTLREALQRTNANAGLDTIRFAPGVVGTITLQGAAGGGLSIFNEVIIVGPGARQLAISGNTNFRVFTISGPGFSSISGLTISGGWIAGGAPGSSVAGGGVYNQGSVQFLDCTFDGNRAVGASGALPARDGGSGSGGAIANLGSLTTYRCTFKNNGATGALGANNPPPDNFTLTSGGNGGSGNGGAILNETDATLFALNCTFVANNAGGAAAGSGHFGGNGGSGNGGAIHNKGTSTITASTIAGNSGFGGAAGKGKFAINDGLPGAGVGGLAAPGANTVGSSICAGNVGNNNTPRDATGTFNSSGYNLIGNADFSSGFNAVGDQTGTNAAPLDPKLGALQDNGGSTDTRALLIGSTALDRGKTFTGSEDQRGYRRPYDDPALPNADGGDGADIGAYEFNGRLVVTTVDDHNDGACDASDCTLREAIISATTQPGVETIEFLPALTGIIQLGSALPILNSSVGIIGPGANRITVRRNSGGDYRIFTISNGTTSGPAVTISGLTISNGNAIASGFPNDAGGAVYNDDGALTLRHCALVGNHANSEGGALYNEGATASSPLVVENCTFSGNSSGNAGGAINNSAALAAITNCTFTGNNAGSYGGGVMNGAGFSGTATMTVRNCTFALNTTGSSGFGSGGGLFSGFGSAMNFANNLFGSNTGGSIQRFGDNPVSQGHNLSIDAAGGDGSTGPGGFLNAPGDIRNTNPMLDALGNFGGRTPTYALLPGSPAINKGNDALAPIRDQRGYGRAGTSDIGAFEFGGVQQGVPLASIVSRKTHGSAGDFDINLPVSGDVGVECRSGGGNGSHRIIFTFATPLISVGSAAISGGSGSVSSSSIGSDTHQLVVNVTSANQQTLTVTLTSVSDTIGNHTQSLSVGIGILFGDSNGDRSVNSGDAQQTRNRSGQLANAASCRSDLNLDGAVNSGDAIIVRSRSGQAIP